MATNKTSDNVLLGSHVKYIYIKKETTQMSNTQKNPSLSEEEYRKKFLSPLYDSGETREEIINKGKNR